MKKINRRNFMRAALAGAGAIGFEGLVNRLGLFGQEKKFDGEESLYGALSPKASVNTGETFLALPDGFQYTVFGKSDSPMTNNQPTPILHDGMAVFTSGGLPGSWILIRNHENSNFADTIGAVSGTTPYDAAAAGGTTTLIINKTSRLPTESFVSLSGTVRNCAGGATLWRTWISCEETTVGISNGFAKPHGYCFEVAPRNPSTPIALTQMGRFKHEAVAVDKTSGIVYLTEDNNPAGFYRYIPNRYGDLAAGGRLQMLTISGRRNYDTRTDQTTGTRMLASWVDISNPDPVSAETNPSAVFEQGFNSGGAVFTRLEGCFAGLDEIYFTSTNGGNQGLGQVWKYEARKKSKFGHLSLLFESPNAQVFDFPDNLCFGANGNLLICEDGSTDNYLKILAPNGSVSEFAKNIVPNFESYEFTGCAFSPDLKTLFVNIQTPGLTFAIWGNW